MIFNANSSSILFSFKGLKIVEFSDFEKIKDKKIILDGVNNAASVSEYNEEYYGLNKKTPTGKGQIYFKNIKHVGDSLILSGGFGFKEQAQDTTVTYGRFDYILSKSMFEDSKIE